MTCVDNIDRLTALKVALNTVRRIMYILEILFCKNQLILSNGELWEYEIHTYTNTH